MSGVPLEQARKAIDACLALLTETDTFGIVAFDDRIETLGDTLLTGSLENREHARKFLDRIDARGGTELADGVEAVCRLVGGGGDILILTDGQVAGAEAILARVRQTGSRLHCLGIGSASQDRFLTLLARETGGISHFVTPRERVDLSAVNLFASLGRPLAAGLTAEPEVEPAPPPAVFGGAPVLLFGEAGPEQRELNLRWDGGSRRLPIEPAGGTLGETLRLLRGARLITDWESRYPAEEALAPLERRKQNRIAMRLRALSEEYGLASREMSLVAVVKRAGDRPGELPDTRVVPVGFPQDMRFDDFFAGSFGGVQACFGAPPDFEPELARLALPRPLAAFSRRSSAPAGRPARSQAPSPDDALLALAARLQPDGGMPGATLDERAAATAVALLAFLAHGHTKDTGAFRSHVRRLASFLKALQGLSQERQEIVAAVLKANKTGHAPAGDWVRLAQSGRGLWPELEALVTA